VRCPHSDRCPGCALLDLPYSAQLETKGRRLAEALAGYAALTESVVGPAMGADPATEYRVRAKLVAAGGALGLFERGGHEIVDIPGCRVLTPRVYAAVAELRALLTELPAVSSVDVRETDAGMIVTLALPPRTTASERSRVSERVCSEVKGVVTLALSSREPDAPQLLGADLRVVHGPEAVKHTFKAGTPYHYAAPGAFTQTHPGQARWLHRAIERVLGELSTQPAGLRPLAGLGLLELYAGSGALALRLAARGANVTHVESFEPAVKLTERAAHEQGIAMRALASDAASALKLLVRERARFDAVLVNPPRRGLDPDVRRLVAELSPRLVIYVSCDPVTLARDADHFARLGQRLMQVTPFDMIPQSDAVETLALLRPFAPPLPRVLHAGSDFLAVEKAPHEPTLPQSEHRGSLLERVRRLPGAREAVAATRLELGTSGVCVFARTPSQLQASSAALEHAELRYLALVRGPTRAQGTLRAASRNRTPLPAELALRYRRRELIGGHSLLEVFAVPSQAPQIKTRLASIGHPVLGDTKQGDARSNTHFFHRHGLDRTFLHVSELSLGGDEPTLRAELPADLERVLESLRAP
jgi:23S rRNA (uracil1939-C5)-methyltransferase